MLGYGTGKKMKYNRIRAVGAFWPFLKKGILTESFFGAYKNQLVPSSSSW